MPLDQAVYVSSINKIMACRGPFLYKCNATTGEKEAELLVRSTPWRSVLEYHPILGRIFWAGKHDPSLCYDYDVNLMNSGKMSPVIIDPTAMTVIEEVVPDLTDPECFRRVDQGSGCNVLFYLDGNIYFDYGGIYFSSQSILWTPFATARSFQAYSAGYTTCQNHISFGETAFDMCYDSTNDRLWMAHGQVQEITYCDKTEVGCPTLYTIDYSYILWLDYPAANPVGICHCPSNNNLYIAQGNQFVLKCHTIAADPNHPVTSLINLARVNAAPFKIKYWSVTGMIYVPCFGDNTVCIINPASADAITVKTGFSAPIDVVFTGTKAFAVQQGSIGLKEIL